MLMQRWILGFRFKEFHKFTSLRLSSLMIYQVHLILRKQSHNDSKYLLPNDGLLHKLLFQFSMNLKNVLNFF